MLKDWWRHLFAEEFGQDPIDHPALMRMTSDELADLPLWPLDETVREHVRVESGFSQQSRDRGRAGVCG